MQENNTELSDRELEILTLVADGLSNKEIASRLYLSVNTVKVHLRNVFAKIDVQSRTEATVYAIQKGLVVVPGATISNEPASSTPTPPAIEIEPPLPLARRALLIGLAALAIGLAFIAGPRSVASSNAQAEPFSDSATSNSSVNVNASDTAWEAVGTSIIAIGGESVGGVTGAVEIFDTKSQVWKNGASKPAPVANVAAAVLQGKVIVPGGYTPAGVPTTTVEAYNVVTDSWSRLASLPGPRFGYSLATYHDQLYLFGGWDGSRYADTVYRYDPTTDRWTTRASLPIARGFSGAAALGDSIYVVGGYADGHEFDTCDRYLPDSDRWESCAPLTVARGGLGLAAIGGRLYAIGGGWTGYLAFSERYDPQADAWSVVPTPFTGQWRGMGVTSIDTNIYALGGWTGQYVGVVEKYNPFPFNIFVPSAAR
jgi:DNA-binding CsgD family transcriptional regulator/N-acetylneuraminic acid mutarotase